MWFIKSKSLLLFLQILYFLFVLVSCDEVNVSDSVGEPETTTIINSDSFDLPETTATTTSSSTVAPEAGEETSVKNREFSKKLRKIEENDAVSKPSGSVILEKVVSEAELLSSIISSYNESENNVGVDDLSEDLNVWLAPYFIRKNFPYFLAGHDEEGRPIFISEMGKYDLRSITEKGGDTQVAFEKYARQAIFRINQSLQNASTAEQPVSEALYLVDFDGWDLYQVSYLPNTALLMKLALEHRAFIVDHLAATVIVNANFVVENLIRILRPVFGPAMAKVEVHGTNKAKWLPVVRRVFGAQNLPEWYGGNSKNYKPIGIWGR